MVATITLRLSRICLLLILAVPQSNTRSLRSAGNSETVNPAKPHDGIVDFALGRINPSNREYGQCLDEIRKVVLGQTISRAYFWSNLGALSLVGMFLVVILHQHSLQKRRTAIAAEWLTQYHNSLVRANAQVAEATKRNHELMQALASSLEPGAGNEPGPGSTGKDALAKGRKRGQMSEQGGSVAPATAFIAEEARAPSKSVVAESAFLNSDASLPVKTPEAAGIKDPVSQGLDLVARVNALQQQVNVYKQREKQLLRQVNAAELSLQKEQQRNRSLKGE